MFCNLEMEASDMMQQSHPANTVVSNPHKKLLAIDLKRHKNIEIREWVDIPKRQTIR